MNYQDDDIIVAEDHPADHDSALVHDLSKIANDPEYDGQSVALYRDGDGVRAVPLSEYEKGQAEEGQGEIVGLLDPDTDDGEGISGLDKV